MELCHNFLTRLPPSFTDILSHQGSRQQGLPCEPWKVPLAGQGVLLAGREKTFLNSLTPSDKITTVQTSRSCNKVLSSHRGDVRSCLLWAGFLFLVCYVKSQKDFPFALQHCQSGCYMTLFKSYLKSQLTEMCGRKSVLYFVTPNIMFTLCQIKKKSKLFVLMWAKSNRGIFQVSKFTKCSS